MSMKEETEFNWCAERLRALADPERLRIVTSLLAGPKNVGTLAEELNDAVVKVSHHLGVLRHSDLVTTKKMGRFVEYALHPQVFIVANISETENFLDLGCCRLELPVETRKKRGRQ